MSEEEKTIPVRILKPNESESSLDGPTTTTTMFGLTNNFTQLSPTSSVLEAIAYNDRIVVANNNNNSMMASKLPTTTTTMLRYIKIDESNQISSKREQSINNNESNNNKKSNQRECDDNDDISRPFLPNSNNSKTEAADKKNKKQFIHSIYECYADIRMFIFFMCLIVMLTNALLVNFHIFLNTFCCCCCS